MKFLIQFFPLLYSSFLGSYNSSIWLIDSELRLEVEGLRLLSCDTLSLSEQFRTFWIIVVCLSLESSSPRSISPLTQHHIPEDWNLQQHLVSCRFDVTTGSINIIDYWVVALNSSPDKYQWFGENLTPPAVFISYSEEGGYMFFWTAVIYMQKYKCMVSHPITP